MAFLQGFLQNPAVPDMMQQKKSIGPRPFDAAPRLWYNPVKRFQSFREVCA